MVSVIPRRYPAIAVAGVLVVSICLTAIIAGGIIMLTQSQSSGMTGEKAPEVETEFDAQTGSIFLTVRTETPVNASQLSIQQQSEQKLQESLLRDTNTTTQSVAALVQTDAVTRSQTGPITDGERIQLHLANRSFTNADSLQVLYTVDGTTQLLTTFQFVAFTNR